MIKKIGLWLALAGVSFLTSCSVNTETTYFKDSATSMESNVLMDKGMLDLMTMSNSSGKQDLPDMSKLTTDWKSLYDIQKDGLITLNQDSAKVLKKMFMKVNKQDGEILGLSVKYDKLQPSEIMSLLAQSKQLKSLPLQNFAKWDGHALTIDTEKFNVGEFINQINKSEGKPISPPKTKSDSIEAYGKNMISGMVGIMRMFDINFTNTLKFQKPIKTISGKHDFVKQIDSKTIQISVRSRDLLDDGKKLTHKDKKMVIVTE